MNIGEKIVLLKENMGFKNWAEFGKFVGLSGEWIKDSLSKKSTITTVDITRLIKIASKFNVTLDWLVSDDDKDLDLNATQNLALDDIGLLLNNIKETVNNGNAKFYGTVMNEVVSKLTVDSIDIIKKLIQQNL